MKEKIKQKGEGAFDNFDDIFKIELALENDDCKKLVEIYSKSFENNGHLKRKSIWNYTHDHKSFCEDIGEFCGDYWKCGK